MRGEGTTETMTRLNDRRRKEQREKEVEQEHEWVVAGGGGQTTFRLLGLCSQNAFDSS